MLTKVQKVGEGDECPGARLIKSGKKSEKVDFLYIYYYLFNIFISRGFGVLGL